MKSMNREKDENFASKSGCKRKMDGAFDEATTKPAREWTEEEHVQFVSSIFEIGLKEASPSIIIENMSMKQTREIEMITSERVKSKLQKYRKNKTKSREDFLIKYKAFLGSMNLLEKAGAVENYSDRSSSSAGYLTYAVMKEINKEKEESVNTIKETKKREAVDDTLSTTILRKRAKQYVNANFLGSAIQFPILTEAEKKSSLGIAMTFIMGLFLSMSQHLTRERTRAQSLSLSPSTTAKDTTSITDVQSNK